MSVALKKRYASSHARCRAARFALSSEFITPAVALRSTPSPAERLPRDRNFARSDHEPRSLQAPPRRSAPSLAFELAPSRRPLRQRSWLGASIRRNSQSSGPSRPLRAPGRPSPTGQPARSRVSGSARCVRRVNVPTRAQNDVVNRTPDRGEVGRSSDGPSVAQRSDHRLQGSRR